MNLQHLSNQAGQSTDCVLLKGLNGLVETDSSLISGTTLRSVLNVRSLPAFVAGITNINLNNVQTSEINSFWLGVKPFAYVTISARVTGELVVVKSVPKISSCILSEEALKSLEYVSKTNVNSSS